MTTSLFYIRSYLNKRLQKTNVNNDLSIWKEISSRVLQGSILGPILLNLYINDIFRFVFLTAVWLHNGQLWAIIKGTASLTRS